MAKTVNFIKMHGLGNDFVIIENWAGKIKLTGTQVKKLGDRNFGVGFDQLVLIEKSKKADCFMRIYNSDGGEVASCGNASRCVADIIFEASKKTKCAIETKAGIIYAKKVGKQVAIDMGKPILDWAKIPLAKNVDVKKLPLEFGAFKNPVAVSMGNPHVVFFVKGDVAKIDLKEVGPKFENHKFFPKRTNVEFAQVKSKNFIELRVWERGAGETLACGTGACATLVAANLKGFTGKKAKIKLKGGSLDIELNKEGHVIMTGPVERVFVGLIEL